MADKWLLEDGSGGWLLEDGSGYWILEANRDWVPTDLGASCVGWFDLTTASKVTLNSGNISAVTNDAGGSVTLTQATAGNQPPFAVDQGAFFALAGVTDLALANLSTATEYHYFIVGTPNANTSFRTALWAATNEHPLLLQTGTDNVGHYISGFQQFGATTAPASIEALFYGHTTPSAVSQGATNGATPGSTPSAYGATNTNAAVLGNSSGGSQGFGWIRGLVIVSGTLASGDRQKIEGYLAWRYSTVSKLDSAHPYTSAQPTVALGTTIASAKGHLSFTGYQPAITLSTVIAPSVGHLTYGGKVASVSVGTSVSPSTGHLAFTGKQPAVTLTTAVAASVGHLAFGGKVPTVTRTTSVSAAVGHLAFGGKTATVVLGVNVFPSVGHLALGGKLPTVAYTLAVSPSSGHLAFGGKVPTISVSSGLLPSTGHMAFAGKVPTLTTTLNPATGHLGFSGHLSALGLAVGSNTGHIAFNGYMPTYGPGALGHIKVDVGSFVAKPIKVWNGSAWIEKPLKFWTGTVWRATSY